MARSRPPAFALVRLFSVLLALGLTGCTAVTLVSDYDEVTDKGITEFQKSVETFLTGMERTVESEFKKIGESILFIETQRALGKMTDRQAQLHLELQKQASRNVLLAAEGLGLVATEAAINAALGVIRDAVNGALKFPLL